MNIESLTTKKNSDFNSYFINNNDYNTLLTFAATNFLQKYATRLAFKNESLLVDDNNIPYTECDIFLTGMQLNGSNLEFAELDTGIKLKSIPPKTATTTENITTCTNLDPLDVTIIEASIEIARAELSINQKFGRKLLKAENHNIIFRDDVATEGQKAELSQILAILNTRRKLMNKESSLYNQFTNAFKIFFGLSVNQILYDRLDYKVEGNTSLDITANGIYENLFTDVLPNLAIDRSFFNRYAPGKFTWKSNVNSIEKVEVLEQIYNLTTNNLDPILDDETRNIYENASCINGSTPNGLAQFKCFAVGGGSSTKGIFTSPSNIQHVGVGLFSYMAFINTGSTIPVLATSEIYLANLKTIPNQSTAIHFDLFGIDIALGDNLVLIKKGRLSFFFRANEFGIYPLNPDGRDITFTNLLNEIDPTSIPSPSNPDSRIELSVFAETVTVDGNNKILYIWNDASGQFIFDQINKDFIISTASPTQEDIRFYVRSNGSSGGANQADGFEEIIVTLSVVQTNPIDRTTNFRLRIDNQFRSDRFGYAEKINNIETNVRDSVIAKYRSGISQTELLFLISSTNRSQSGATKGRRLTNRENIIAILNLILTNNSTLQVELYGNGIGTFDTNQTDDFYRVIRDQTQTDVGPYPETGPNTSGFVEFRHARVEMRIINSSGQITIRFIVNAFVDKATSYLDTYFKDSTDTVTGNGTTKLLQPYINTVLRANLTAGDPYTNNRVLSAFRAISVFELLIDIFKLGVNDTMNDNGTTRDIFINTDKTILNQRLDNLLNGCSVLIGKYIGHSSPDTNFNVLTYDHYKVFKNYLGIKY